MPAVLTLTPQQCGNVLAQLPPEARRPESGCLYAEGVLTVPDCWAEAALAADPDRAYHPVPVRVAAVQLRLALLDAGLLDRVETAAAADRRLGVIWGHAPRFKRTDSATVALLSAAGLTGDEIDAVFRAAVTTFAP